MSIALSSTLQVPRDPRLPGLTDAAQPEQMLELCRAHLTNVPSAQRDAWTDCAVMDAVYQPGRACRIAYALNADDDERPEIVYARWSRERRMHASAVRVRLERGWVDLHRYPRDRRMRAVRSMQRDDWLRHASRQWFCEWLGEGAFADEGWRCTPIKYVPESRLVCRLKGRWQNSSGEQWVRAYVRMTRRDDAARQLERLRTIEAALSRTDCGISVPHVLGVVDEKHLIATEFVRGVTLRDAAANEGPRLLARVSAALAAMGRAIGPDSIHQFPLNQPAVAPAAMLADLHQALPASHHACVALAAWRDSRPALPRRAGLVHGDLHSRQVILKGGRTCVVDWERAVLGDPTQDIANLAAEFDAAALLAAAAAQRGCAAALSTFQSQLSQSHPAAREHWAPLCMQAWREAGGLFDSSTVRWWMVRAFVLRAWGLQRHLRCGWPDAAAALLERAAQTQQNGLDWLKA